MIETDAIKGHFNSHRGFFITDAKKCDGKRLYEFITSITEKVPKLADHGTMTPEGLEDVICEFGGRCHFLCRWYGANAFRVEATRWYPTNYASSQYVKAEAIVMEFVNPEELHTAFYEMLGEAM